MLVRIPALAVATALGAILLTSGCRKAPAEDPPDPVPVLVATVSRADIPDILSLRGRLVPPVEEDATLAPQVAGRLVRLVVREGDAVPRGALLAEVDRAPLEEADATAAAALAKARQDEAVRSRALSLTEHLLERGIVSSEERDGDRAALETARAARVEAEGRLAQTTRQRSWTGLRAPFDGVVAQVLRHPGEAVDGTPATPVLRLLGTSATEVSADADATDLSRVKSGDEVAVTLPGVEASAPGRVTRVARSVDPATGVGEIRARLSARASVPLLSQVSISVVLAVHRAALVVPSGALRRSEQGREEVVLVSKGAAQVRPVKTALHSTNLVEVVDGLSGGETVVVDSPLGLEDGVPLAVPKSPGR